jgi:hypothetical protein
MNLHALGYPKSVTIFWFMGFGLNMMCGTTQNKLVLNIVVPKVPNGTHYMLHSKIILRNR